MVAAKAAIRSSGPPFYTIVSIGARSARDRRVSLRRCCAAYYEVAIAPPLPPYPLLIIVTGCCSIGWGGLGRAIVLGVVLAWLGTPASRGSRSISGRQDTVWIGATSTRVKVRGVRESREHENYHRRLVQGAIMHMSIYSYPLFSPPPRPQPLLIPLARLLLPCPRVGEKIPGAVGDRICESYYNGSSGVGRAIFFFDLKDINQ